MSWASFNNGFWTAMSTVSVGLIGGPQPQGGQQGTPTATQGGPAKDQAAVGREDKIKRLDQQLDQLGVSPVGALEPERQNLQLLYDGAKALVASGLKHSEDPQCAKKVEGAVKDHKAEFEKVQTRIGNQLKGWKEGLDRLNKLVAELKKPVPGREDGEAREIDELAAGAEKVVSTGLAAVSADALGRAEGAVKTLSEKVATVGEAVAARAEQVAACGQQLEAYAKKPLAGTTVAEGQAREKLVAEARKVVAASRQGPTEAAVKQAQAAVKGVSDQIDEVEKAIAVRAEQLRQAWKKRVQDARLDLEECLGKVAGEFAKAVKADVGKSDELRHYTEKKDAALASLSEANVKAVEDAAVQVKALIDAREEALKKAKTLPADLAAKEKTTGEFRDLCVQLVALTNTVWNPIALSFMAGTPLAAEFGEDRITIESARVSAADLLTRVTACLSKLGAEKPAAGDVSEGLALVGTALPDIGAAHLRVKKNHGSLTPAGLEARVRELADAAGRDDNKRLSNDRAGQLVADFRKTPRTLLEATNLVDQAVRQQHHPRLRDWLKVLQLGTGGEVRAGKVGYVTPPGSGKRTTVHMTLYIVNVDAGLPSVLDDADTIMTALLPPLTGQIGTHVTLELFGEKARTRNPHCFRNGTTVINECPVKDWDHVRTEMIKLLDKEIDRLKAMVQQFIDRRGLHASDQRAG